MRKNERFVIEIRDVTEKGFGVGLVDGFVLLVDGGLTGDVVEAHVVKVKKRYGYAKILKIVTPSPHRIKSACAVSEKCGGCQWQHCEYRAQLIFKKKIVTDALEKIGGIADPPVFDVIGMNEPARYRNKAVFPIVPAGNGFAIGMYAPRSHRIVEVDDCLIQHPAHVGVLAAIKKVLKGVSAYDEVSHSGLLRYVIVRTSLFTGEIMVILVVNDRRGLSNGMELTEVFDSLGVSTFLLNYNTAKGNTILSDDFEILSGSGFITEKIGDIEYRLSARSFFQINPAQTKILYETAIKQAELDETQTVIDAHAGVGGVALFAARHVKKVFGVEIVPAAVEDAKKNAALNNIENAEFLLGAAEEIIPVLMKQSPPDVIFLDPPRKGCDAVLLQAIIEAGIKTIVYISCDPATLARDVKMLINGGYTLSAVQPVDMFPFTGKVECSVLLQRTVRSP